MQERSRKQSNIFRILRLCLGLNLNEMAEKCMVSAAYLTELERGIKTKPSDDILTKISEACDIKIETLKFFIEDQQGKSLDYQKHLLASLDNYVQTLKENSKD